MINLLVGVCGLQWGWSATANNFGLIQKISDHEALSNLFLGSEDGLGHVYVEFCYALKRVFLFFFIDFFGWSQDSCVLTRHVSDGVLTWRCIWVKVWSTIVWWLNFVNAVIIWIFFYSNTDIVCFFCPMWLWMFFLRWFLAFFLI